MKLIEKDFVGPFPADVKPSQDGLYWSAPIHEAVTAKDVYEYGTCVFHKNLPDTIYVNNCWNIIAISEIVELIMQDRLWIGLTADAAERVAKETLKKSVKTDQKKRLSLSNK